MLGLKNVAKKFGEIVALKDIDFKVTDGEFVYLTGPSGAGKTTIIRLIIGEIIPDSGEIVFDGSDITKLKIKDIPKVRQQIGVIFQDYKVLNDRTVRENVEIALAVIGLPQDQWKDRVDQVLDLVGLTERQNLFPSQLSGGELQRVSLARALVVNPKIILADEPTGNLDWDTANSIMQLFEKINQKGKTIIMATHNEELMKNFPKRRIRVVNGKIISDEENKVEKKKDRNIDKDQK